VRNRLDALAHKYFFHALAVRNVHLVERRALANVLTMAAVKVVNHNNMMAGVEQRGGDVAADKAGAACN